MSGRLLCLLLLPLAAGRRTVMQNESPKTLFAQFFRRACHFPRVVGALEAGASRLPEWKRNESCRKVVENGIRRWQIISYHVCAFSPKDTPHPVSAFDFPSFRFVCGINFIWFSSAFWGTWDYAAMSLLREPAMVSVWALLQVYSALADANQILRNGLANNFFPRMRVIFYLDAANWTKPLRDIKVECMCKHFEANFLVNIFVSVYSPDISLFLRIILGKFSFFFDKFPALVATHAQSLWPRADFKVFNFSFDFLYFDPLGGTIFFPVRFLSYPFFFVCSS